MLLLHSESTLGEWPQLRTHWAYFSQAIRATCCRKLRMADSCCFPQAWPPAPLLPCQKAVTTAMTTWIMIYICKVGYFI